MRSDSEVVSYYAAKWAIFRRFAALHCRPGVRQTPPHQRMVALEASHAASASGAARAPTSDHRPGLRDPFTVHFASGSAVTRSTVPSPSRQQPRASRLDAKSRQPDHPPGDSCWSRRSARARSDFGSAGIRACSIDLASSGGAQDGAFTLLRLLAVMRTSSTTRAARSCTCSRPASRRAFGCAEHGAFSAVEATSGLWKLNVGFSPSGLG